MNLDIINSKYGDGKEEVYEQISNNYVAESDMTSIFEFCKKNKARVTFRETGSASISQLKKGAAAKPHRILEKSVQKPRLSPTDINSLSRIIGGKENLNKILGIVGRWTKQAKQEGSVAKGLKGLYLTPLSPNALNSDLKPYAAIIKPPNPKKINMTAGEKVGRKDYFIKLTLSESDETKLISNAKKKVENLKSAENIKFAQGPDFKKAPYYISYKLTKKFLKELISENGERLFKYLFTGDYDMHDMFTNKAFAQGSRDEQRLINELNKNINSRGHREITQRQIQDLGGNVIDYNMIQHGAQEKYLANMHNNEKGAPIDPVVAQASKSPLAACSPEGWEMIRAVDELSQFYKRAGINMKTSWASDGIKRSNSVSKLRTRKLARPNLNKGHEKRRRHSI